MYCVLMKYVLSMKKISLWILQQTVSSAIICVLKTWNCSDTVDVLGNFEHNTDFVCALNSFVCKKIQVDVMNCSQLNPAAEEFTQHTCSHLKFYQVCMISHTHSHLMLELSDPFQVTLLPSCYNDSQVQPLCNLHVFSR